MIYLRIIAATAVTVLAVWMGYSAYVVGRILIANYELVSAFAGWAP